MRRERARRRGLCGLIAVLGLLFLGLYAPLRAASGVYAHARVDGVINPIKSRHVARAVAKAKAERAEFLLLTVDTPGGLVVSMQEIVQSISNANLPVVGFVAPRSAQATSAGAFILLATDLAAMAPGTRIGAAHPVADGKSLDEVMDKKATNSLASLIRSLAERRGRPGDIAESLVRESVSFTAEDALAKKLIELHAVNEADLLTKLDGREVGGKKLKTRGLGRVDVSLSTVDRVLDKLADPTLTSLLLSIGVLAILYELGSPGVGAGGAIGAVLLVLGLLGSSVLPIETSAVMLFVIGVAAIALEVKLPTHGVLGGAGVLALLLGAMLMIDAEEYFGGVSAVKIGFVAPIVIAAAAGFLLLARATRRALQAPPATGSEALIGKRGEARSSFGSAAAESVGQVFVDGARWSATSAEPEIRVGDRIEVVAVSEKPTRLVVRRVPEGS